MPDTIATYIVLHNFCVANNRRIGNEWIVEVENYLVKRFSEREIQDGSELQEEKVEIVRVKKKILTSEDAPTIN